MTPIQGNKAPFHDGNRVRESHFMSVRLENIKRSHGFPRLLPLFLTAAVVAMFSLASAAALSAYDYPITDRYAATIIGTPSELKAELPTKICEKELQLAPIHGRQISDIFWYQQNFRYSLAYQKQKAPLIFIIAGTGANYRSNTMQTLKRAFYQAGFNVVTLTSPTYPDFIVTQSSTGMPGNMREDAQDLYRVMKRIWDDIKERVDVSDFYLTGYSLGGAQSAFIAKLDDDLKLFNFKKVLLINPPVDLYTSMNILDKMLSDNIPEGLDNFDAYFETMMAKLSRVYRQKDDLNINNDFLYSVYKEIPPKDEEMEALIGISFRLFAANMIFTADVANNAGYIVPKGRKLSSTDSTTDYFKVASQTSFSDYFDELFYPYFRNRQPGLTREELIGNQSLASIREYLVTSDKIGVFTNADDPILTPGELDFLVQVFGKRATIYPHGGHIGNIDFRLNVADMIRFFK